jgi:hypothetical protein
VLYHFGYQPNPFTELSVNAKLDLERNIKSYYKKKVDHCVELEEYY